MKKVLALVITFALCAMMLSSALVSARTPAAPEKGSRGDGKYKDGEIIIQFKGGVTPEDVVAARNSVGALTKKQIKRAERAERKGDLELATIQSGLSVEAAIGIL